MGARKKEIFLKTWHLFLLIVFFYSIQHLVRDILQDIFGIHNTFTEFGHFQADISRIPSALKFLFIQPLARFSTFPIEIFMIVAISAVWKRKKFTKLDWVITITLVFILITYSLNILFDPDKGLLRPIKVSYTEPRLGFSFNPEQAIYLGLDPKETYLALLDGLKPSFIRIPIFWDEVQKNKEEFDFSNIDWMMDEAKKRGILVTVNLGYTTFRYPECHEPRWAWDLEGEEFNTALLAFLKKTVFHLAKFSNIEAWQVENERELWLSKPQCRIIKSELFLREIEKVREVDGLRRPIVITHGGKTTIGNFWQKRVTLGDIFAVSFFGKSYNKSLHCYTNRLWLRNILLEKATTERLGKHFWISEFQAEAWGKTPLNKISPEEAQKTMNPEILKKNLELLGKYGGAERVYFWGVEWWYKELLEGRSEMWEMGRALLQKTS